MSTDLLLYRSTFSRSAPFPLHALPEVMRNFISSLAKSLALDPVAIALPVLTVAGAAIGNSRRLAVTDDYSAPPNLWSAILSGDDLRLHRAGQIILQPLIDRQQTISDSVQNQYKRYSLDLNNWTQSADPDRGPRPTHPVRDYRQFFFTDPDFRQIPGYLHRQPRGCLIFAGDLTPWFQNTSPQMFSIFDAQPFTFDRAPLSSRFTSHAFVALTGFLPERSFQSPPSNSPRQNALAPRIAARFLLARPQLRPHLSRANKNPISTGTYFKADWKTLVNRLLNIEAVPSLWGACIKPVIAPLQAKAADVLHDAHDHLILAADQETCPQRRTHLMNLIEYIPRLALILGLTDLVTRRGLSSIRPEDSINARAMNSAVELIDWFSAETKRVYADQTMDQHASRILSVVTLISRRGGSITVRELMHTSRSFRNSADQARAFLQNLAKEGLGRLTWDSSSNHKAPTFHLNPDVNGNESPAGAIKNDPIVTAPSKNPP